MALRGSSSFLRSLGRLANAHVATSTRLSSNQQKPFDLSLFGRANGIEVGGVRMFGTTPRVDSVAKELTDALKQEITAEQELAASSGADAAASFPGFSIETKDAEIRLTKKHGNEDILVVFNVNHSVDIAEDGPEEQAPPSPVALPPFTIEITKDGERLCFHLELVETEQEGEYDFQVEEFYIAPAVKKGDSEDVPAHIYATSGKYIDPSVQELLYVRYLEERGFDGTFLRNLVQFASAHEHHLYIGLLNKMKAFIAK